MWRAAGLIAVVLAHLWIPVYSCNGTFLGCMDNVTGPGSQEEFSPISSVEVSEDLIPETANTTKTEDILLVTSLESSTTAPVEFSIMGVTVNNSLIPAVKVSSLESSTTEGEAPVEFSIVGVTVNDSLIPAVKASKNLIPEEIHTTKLDEILTMHPLESETEISQVTTETPAKGSSSVAVIVILSVLTFAGLMGTAVFGYLYIKQRKHVSVQRHRPTLPHSGNNEDARNMLTDDDRFLP